MNFSLNFKDLNTATFTDSLETIFCKMEEDYENVAGQYGFNCTGCEDSCCLTRFYHHTMLEHLYLEKGFKTLSLKTQKSILKRADHALNHYTDSDLKGETPVIMCPLNNDGRCILYKFRPMVCRLHGIEHELAKPGHPPLRSSGCELFTMQTSGMDYIRFDRTPHYMALASLEKEIRQATGYGAKLKNTIAEMLLL